MRHRYHLLVLLTVFFIVVPLYGQERVDSATAAQIRDEGMNRSQVMELLSYMTDVCGPRLTWSPEYMQAAEWAMKKMKELGLENIHLEPWRPAGRGWSLRRYSANVIDPKPFPLISFPMAWSPGTKGTLSGEVIYMDPKIDSTFEFYRGKLKGKFVLLNDSTDIRAHFEPQATRTPDSVLLRMANAGVQEPRGGFRRGMRQGGGDFRTQALLRFKKIDMCMKEGAAALLSIAQGDGGTIFVAQASVPMHPDTPFTKRVNAYDPQAPKILPQIAVGSEHYNRLIRILKKGIPVKMEMNLEVAFSKEDSGYNVIGEIPGSDLKDEIVMVGGHFDSWQAGTGATDDATGSIAALEALRIIKKLDLKPRRTIRIGLWGGEEEGLIGSAAYVKKHFGERAPQDQGGAITYKPEAEKFSVYFNHDNGSGKLRGVYMQGNEAVRPIFRAWLAPFRDLGASTLTAQNTGGTDHLSFDAIGLPAFQFIQDQLEYGTRTHHSNMDVWDRIQDEDMKQASVIMATFVYQAAVRDEKFPRKPVPPPQPPRGQ